MQCMIAGIESSLLLRKKRDKRRADVDCPVVRRTRRQRSVIRHERGVVSFSHDDENGRLSHRPKASVGGEERRAARQCAMHCTACIVPLIARDSTATRAVELDASVSLRYD